MKSNLKNLCLKTSLQKKKWKKPQREYKVIYLYLFQLEEAKTKSLVDIVKEKETKEFVTQDFDRFEEHFVGLYKGKFLTSFQYIYRKWAFLQI